MDFVVALVTAVGGAAAAILGGLAMLVKARSVESAQISTLRRLWDQIESKGLVPHIPESLRKDVRRLLGRPEPADEGSQGASE